MPLIKRFGELGLHVRETREQPAEHHDFGGEEQPHTDLRGIELLFLRRKVMLKVSIMLGMNRPMSVMPYNRCGGD